MMLTELIAKAQYVLKAHGDMRVGVSVHGRDPTIEFLADSLQSHVVMDASGSKFLLSATEVP